MGGFGPEYLGVAREPLVQPDVLPAGGRDAVAEPLVGDLMGDGSLAHRRAVVANHALGLERRIERGVGEDRVAERGEGIGAEQLREDFDHLRDAIEEDPLLLGQVGRERLDQRDATRSLAES